MTDANKHALTASEAQPAQPDALREALHKITAPLPNEPLLGDRGWTPGKQTEFWRKRAIEYRTIATGALAAPVTEPRQCSDQDTFIFEWFNEREPDAMADCLAAFRSRTQGGS